MSNATPSRGTPCGLTVSLFLLLLPFPLLTVQPARAADGEALFRQQCGTCHTVRKDDGPRAGPPLYGVIGRKAGTVPNFEYSDALRGAGFAWDAAHLERWLTNSAELVPGSVMNYRQEDDTVRKGIVQYLQNHAAN